MQKRRSSRPAFLHLAPRHLAGRAAGGGGHVAICPVAAVWPPRHGVLSHTGAAAWRRPGPGLGQGRGGTAGHRAAVSRQLIPFHRAASPLSPECRTILRNAGYAAR